MEIVVLVVLFLYVFKVYMAVEKIHISPHESGDTVQITVGKWTKTVERDWLKDF